MRTNRVYSDRLVSVKDVEKFQGVIQVSDQIHWRAFEGNVRVYMQSHAKKAFPQFNVAKYFMPHGGEQLVFCEFLDPPASLASSGVAAYNQCTDMTVRIWRLWSEGACFIGLPRHQLRHNTTGVEIQGGGLSE